ncbi:mechanosensitive ion channel family protein [Novosphingobium sp. M1R2S20]|uniref:Mechanosensitive ion channel family protein n=1 Tax=Novosphingobium rhizovicinum TaxID=3228928 RepID=A0ABV3RAH4_9SPHN
MTRSACRWWAALLMILLAPPAFAQLVPASSDGAEETEEAVPADSYGRETPRGTVSGLLAAMAERDYARAANYFEAKARGEQLARQLQAVLDAGGALQPFGALSNEPTGVLEDGLDPSRERVGELGNAEQTPILLTRSINDDGAEVWRISRKTSAAVRSMRPEITPDGENGTEIAGASLLDWMKLLGIAVLVFFGFHLINAVILAIVGRVIREREQSPVYRFAQAAMPPLSLLFSTIVFQLWARTFPVSIVARQLLLRYVGIFAWVALAWFLARLIDAVAKLMISRMEGQERRQAVSVLDLLRRAAKILLLFVAAVAILDTFGIDVTTGVAALGIGGIALALGAQKTVENLVGSVTLIADKPVQVGDFCKVGDVVGTVEDIGIRSTRIRTLERTVVTIPNGDFSSRQIENYAKRDQFLFNPVIGVEYGIGSARLLQAVETIEKVLHDHPRIVEPGARARFTTFGDSSLNIEVFSYMEAADYDESLVIRQDLMLTIFARLEELDVGIAFPTRTLHIVAGDAAAGEGKRSGQEAPALPIGGADE